MHTELNKPEPNKNQIQGWGIDLDMKDRPAVPMWNRIEDTGSHYEDGRIPLQKVKFEELKSIERPDMTPVFGQTVPLSGLSGTIRRFAFRYSEGSFGHWLPLLLADRVNVWEGLADDLLHLRVPNVWKEMGLQSEWKYNKVSLIRKTILIGLFTGAAVNIFLALKNNKKDLV